MADDIRPEWLLPLEDRRNEIILRAAFDVFIEKGIQGATMLEIATRAKVSKETLYARFDNKDGLVFAIMGWGARQAGVDAAPFLDGPIEDPAQALEDYAATVFGCMMRPENLAMYRMLLAESVRRPDIGVAHEELFMGPAKEVLARFVAELNRRGLAEIDDVRQFADDFVGLLQGNVRHRALINVENLTEAQIEAHARRATRRLLRAYAPKAEALRKAG